MRMGRRRSRPLTRLPPGRSPRGLRNRVGPNPGPARTEARRQFFAIRGTPFEVDDNRFVQVGLALVLGLLIGMQRERTQGDIAGIRTFTLITLLGAVCALLAPGFGGWTVGAGLLAVAALLIVANLLKQCGGDADFGLTTEIAAVLSFAIGAMLTTEHTGLGVVLGGLLVILLHFKEAMHGFVERIGAKDLRAIMQFVLITLVILPVLPNHSFGPYQVFNPFKIWLLVVLIVAISLAGYVAYKVCGKTAGALLGGVFGGLVSSTATTVSYARRSRGARELAGLGALVILIASATVYPRILMELGAVAHARFWEMAPPLLAMFGICLVLAVLAWLRVRRRSNGEMPEPGNPAELKSALLFAGLYAVVGLAVAWAKDRFGDAGLYSVAVISGLTDVDAITLSTGKLVAEERVAPGTGWRAILIASMANLLFKGGIVAVLGGARLFAWVGVLFAIVLVAGGAILWLWPAA